MRDGMAASPCIKRIECFSFPFSFVSVVIEVVVDIW